jgi:uncharacterized protein (TIGR02271 family)
MNDQTIVAVYDTPAHAELAIQDIMAAGVPERAISQHTGASSGIATGTTMVEAVREQGFWTSLFGGEPDHDTTVYDRSMESGSTIVTVIVSDVHADRVLAILESHHPVDLDERAAGYGVTQTTTSREPLAPLTQMAPAASPVPASEEEKIQLAEESLAVGKRVVNRGGTRIRRFVVETPVEETVSLHSEKVTLDRRPVTDGRPVTDADFTDRIVEMTEASEEAVVNKSARVVEEVSLHKETTERLETVREAIRKDEVEIERIQGGAETTDPLDPRAPQI